jgi:hypothetical protein
MINQLVKCMTPDCPNMSYHTYCLSCSAKEASRALLKASEGLCTHGHSVTGDYGMIKRLLPEYDGGHPQPGYMLDVCKTCLKELPERPYQPAYPGRRH